LREILSLNPAARVVMVSALQEDAVVKECLSQGAKAFIPKAKIYSGNDDFKDNVLAVIENVLKAA
jgi:DNA-binding NarL/FixJ family response regulator